MDIKDLQYVNSIIEWNSFSKAAKQLYISQPALSQSIKRLESELGLTLFLRDRNYVIPTDAALLIRQQSQPILQAFQRLQHTTDGRPSFSIRKSARPLIRVTVNPSRWNAFSMRPENSCQDIADTASTVSSTRPSLGTSFCRHAAIVPITTNGKVKASA